MTACSVMPTDMKPGGKHGVNSQSEGAKNTIFQGYAQVALTELYAQQGTIDVSVIAKPARDARAVAEKNYKVGGLELIMWSQRLQPKIDKPDTDKTKADVTEIEVKHPYGVAKFQANAAKYSEIGTDVVSPFWYVIKKDGMANMKLGHDVITVGAATLKVPKFVNIAALEKGDKLTYSL